MLVNAKKIAKNSKSCDLNFLIFLYERCLMFCFSFFQYNYWHQSRKLLANVGEIYSALLYRSRQRSLGTQPYLNAKLVRPASRISLSRSNTQLKHYLKEKTIIPFCRYRRIHSHLCTKITEMIFHTKRAP